MGASYIEGQLRRRPDGRDWCDQHEDADVTLLVPQLTLPGGIADPTTVGRP